MTWVLWSFKNYINPSSTPTECMRTSRTGSESISRSQLKCKGLLPLCAIKWKIFRMYKSFPQISLRGDYIPETFIFYLKEKNDVHFSFFGTVDFFLNILHCPVLQTCLPKGSISYQCVTLSLFLSLSFDFADPYFHHLYKGVNKNPIIYECI